jgi:ABC-2 type transport system ATP-binding protein
VSLPIIEVRGLRRAFGPIKAVDGVSFDILRGQVVGFIGANGAGKTTTMRIMATLEMPDEGEIRISGFDTLYYPSQVRRRIGWMPDAYGTYEDVTVFEYLDFYGRALGFRGTERLRRVRDVMEFTDLQTIADRPMDRLSKGMGQRLCLGRTLLHDPDVLILDEPAAGLDPRARIEFQHLIRLLSGEGKTIFISSHILSELGQMCDTLLFIDNGKIVHQGSSEAMKRDATQPLVRVETADDPARLLEWVTLNANVQLVEALKNGARISFERDDPSLMAATLRKMLNDGLVVTDFHREERRLEDAFVDLLKKLEQPEPSKPMTLPPPALPPG